MDNNRKILKKGFLVIEKVKNLVLVILSSALGSLASLPSAFQWCHCLVEARTLRG